jgi:hypothetical protein
MLRTKAEKETRFGPGFSRALVPKGMPVSPCKCGTGEILYFVENFGSFIPKSSMAYHDAKHYGIVVTADDVEDVPCP